MFRPKPEQDRKPVAAEVWLVLAYCCTQPQHAVQLNKSSTHWLLQLNIADRAGVDNAPMMQPAQQPPLIDLSDLTSDEEQPQIHVPQVAVAPRQQYVAPRVQHADEEQPLIHVPEVAVAPRLQHAPLVQHAAPRLQHAARNRGCRAPLVGWLACLILAWILFYWLTVSTTLSLLLHG